MKTALIQPKTFHTWEALNLGYLGAALKKNGHSDIEFFSGFYDDDRQIIEGCKDADVIGFSCTSPQMRHALQLAEKIKTNKNLIVFGGVHASALPEETLNHPVVDTVVKGEGEKAFIEIVEKKLKGIVQRDYIKNPDDIPFSDRILIKQERNIRTAFKDNGYRIASILAGRGCPFKCSFCASRSVWSRKARFRSPENIFEEFQKVTSDLNIDFIKFADDTLTLKPKNIHEFCSLKIRSGDQASWGCNIRVDTAKPDLLNHMKEAGCRELWIGVESGSPKILEHMNKNISIPMIKSVFKLTREMGFFRRAYILLGMPEETMEDIYMTEKLVDEIKPDMVGFTILAPYPGTEFYDPERHKNVDWSQVDEYFNSMTATRTLSNEMLSIQQKRLSKKYSDRIAFRLKKQAAADAA